MAAPVVVAAGITAGADLLSGLLAGGNSKQLKQAYAYIQKLLAQNEDILPVGQIQNQIDYMNAPGFEQTAQGLSKRLGLSSPLAQAGLAKMNQGFKQQSYLDLIKQNALGKSQRNLSLTQMLAQLAGQFN